MTRRRLRFQPLDYAAAMAFVAYSSTVTATPICLVAMSREMEFSLVGGGTLESVRSGLLILTLLLSAFVAAHFGKARSIGWSCILLGVAMGLYSVAPIYAFLVVALALMGIGGGIVEALLNPMVEELHRDDAGRYLNFLNAFWSIGVLLTVLVTGELLTRGVSWRYIMAGLTGICLLSGMLFLGLRNSGSPRQRTTMANVFRQKLELLKSGGFWMFSGMMFFAGAAEGALTFWSASYIQIHHGGLPRAAGFGVAAFAAGMIVGRLASGWLLKQHLLRQGILFSALGGTVISALLPLVSSIGMVWAVLFLAGLSVACFWPSIQAYAVDCLPFESTATFILLSCGGIAGFGCASWFIGLLAERFSFSNALFSIPAFFIALVALLLAYAAPQNAAQRAGVTRSSSPYA